MVVNERIVNSSSQDWYSTSCSLPIGSEQCFNDASSVLQLLPRFIIVLRPHSLTSAPTDNLNISWGEPPATLHILTWVPVLCCAAVPVLVWTKWTFGPWQEQNWTWWYQKVWQVTGNVYYLLSIQSEMIVGFARDTTLLCQLNREPDIQMPDNTKMNVWTHLSHHVTISNDCASLVLALMSHLMAVHCQVTMTGH